MRILHLIFRLHQAWPLRAEFGDGKGYFDGKTRFLEQEKRVYQPFFALLERNVQKNSRLKFSLIVSGPWLEQAEAFAPDLVSRLQSLVETDQVEILVEPYYHSLAFFYDKNEMADQVRLAQERAAELLGAESEVFVYPDLTYNDKIARWAEEFGFVATVAAASGVDWRSENHVYEATGCRYLRVMLPNLELTNMIATADAKLLVERENKETGERQQLLSLTKFRKIMDLACLRGNLVNLYFEAEIIQRQRAAGIIGFFDDLFQNWAKTPGNQFVHAAEACRVERPVAELSVRETTCWRLVQEQLAQKNQAQASKNDQLMQGSQAQASKIGTAKVPASNTEKALGIYDQVPSCWQDPEQVRSEKALYALRGLTIETDEAALIADFGRLTALDYLNTKFDQKRLNAAVVDLRERAETILAAPKVEEQPEEIKVARVVKPKTPEVEPETKGERLEVLIEQVSDDEGGKPGLAEKDERADTERSVAGEPLVADEHATLDQIVAKPTAKSVKKKRRIRLVFE